MGEARKICLYYIFGEKHTAAALVSENVEAIGARASKRSPIPPLTTPNFVYHECAQLHACP